jgi:hypothetical protein
MKIVKPRAPVGHQNELEAQLFRSPDLVLGKGGGQGRKDGKIIG